MSSEAIASLISNLPADHAAGLASLMARGTDPSVLESLVEESQNSSMSTIIDSYIVNLKQVGFVPNANVTNSTKREWTGQGWKRDAHNLDSLIEKRSVPSMPLVIDLLEQHGFVPVNNTDGKNSKRDISDVGSALQKRTLPDIGLVINRLEAHGFVPSGNRSQSTISKRDNTSASDINTIISQLEAYGFNPNDYMQNNASIPSSTNSSTSASSNSINTVASTTPIGN